MVEPAFQLVALKRSFQALFEVVTGLFPPDGRACLIKRIGVTVAAVEDFAHELALLPGQGQGNDFVGQALQCGRARQGGRHQAGFIQGESAGGVIPVLVQPGLDLGAKQFLAAPVVMDQVGAFAHVPGAVGGHR
ncbi:hypothetical protein D3C81_1849150 [compost metagenome]